MGVLPPPRPLTKEEFLRRIENGARTLNEIDPELCTFLKTSKRNSALGIILGILVFVLIFIVLNIFCK